MAFSARIKARLETIYRSVVELAILNHEVIDKERFDWSQTAAPLFALHRDLERCGPCLVEMAICTSPVDSGRSCSAIDFGELEGERCLP
ncbi:hypothetical protein AS026_11000 [Rhizobium altiplani]|uniref:Uncharacterized protein n=2 Tax=Rhizobium TaxID=379 RepID=K0PTL8_9HYPH|nr:hypothetical protein AS026_11000 [Rhizobium altiplani]CCM80081.1 hypothetical protein BN77_p2170003 [Rhizobium mesoamericanum STM3625]